VLGLGACRKETPAEDKQAATTATAKAEGSDKAEKRAKPRVEDGIDVPTEEDFEDAVEQQITAESDLKKELDQLEKEIEN
jgi:hypothetical protein